MIWITTDKSTLRVVEMKENLHLVRNEHAMRLSACAREPRRRFPAHGNCMRMGASKVDQRSSAGRRGGCWR